MTPQHPEDPNDLNDPIDFEGDVQENFSDDYTDAELADDATYDDAEIYDENWDEESLDAAPAAKPKKKIPLFNLLLIGGALLIGGGILAFQFSGGSSSENPAPVQQTAESQALPSEGDPSLLAMQSTNDQQNTPPAVDAAPPVTPETTQKGFMDDPSQLPGANETAPAAEAPSLPDQPSMTGIDEVPATSPSIAPSIESKGEVTLAQPDMPAPTIETAKPEIPAPTVDTASTELPVPQNLPPITAIKKADTAKTEPTPVIETKVPTEPLPTTEAKVEENTAPTVADTAVQSAREAELQAKLDEAANRIASLEKKMEEQETAPAPVPAADNSAEVEKLRATIAKLEDKVSDLSSRPVSSEASYEEASVKPVVKTPVRKKKPRVSEQPSYSSAASGAWELRGARPGEAMIGKSGQAGLQTVRVGDTLAGIGQVRSIAQQGGRWIVQGSSGSISQ